MFVKALLHHPEEVKKAQAEIDAVLGTERFPTAADRDRLPYFEAFYLETLRMHSMGRLGSLTQLLNMLADVLNIP